MKLIRDFIAVLRRELGMFNSYKTFSRLSIGLPILSFVVFILLFRTGVPHDIPIAVYDPGNTPLSRQLSRMIDATPSARVAYHITDLAEGERMMKEGKIDAIVSIPRSLEKDIYSNKQSNVVAYINGLNLVKNGMLNRDIQTVVMTFSSGIQIQTLMKQGISEKEAYDLMMPIYFEKHILFNPFSNYEYYLLPSFLPLMLMLFTLLTTIFTIGVELKNSTAREWLATGGGNMLVALAGKLAPYGDFLCTVYADEHLPVQVPERPVAGKRNAAFRLGTGLRNGISSHRGLYDRGPEQPSPRAFDRGRLLGAVVYLFGADLSIHGDGCAVANFRIHLPDDLLRRNFHRSGDAGRSGRQFVRLSGLYDALPAAAADYAAANEENMHRRKILGETVK